LVVLSVLFGFLGVGAVIKRGGTYPPEPMSADLGSLKLRNTFRIPKLGSTSTVTGNAR
jgi:hypothetical protein